MTLTRPNLRTNQIGSPGAASIARVLSDKDVAPPHLSTLLLDKNSIGDEGAVAISLVVENNSTITKLDLGNNEIGDDGVAALAMAMRRNGSILELNLELNSFGKAGMANVAYMAQLNESLEKLQFGSHVVTVEGLAVLRLVNSFGFASGKAFNVDEEEKQT